MMSFLYMNEFDIVVRHVKWKTQVTIRNLQIRDSQSKCDSSSQIVLEDYTPAVFIQDGFVGRKSMIQDQFWPLLNFFVIPF